jgi:hypothetical protein
MESDIFGYGHQNQIRLLEKTIPISVLEFSFSSGSQFRIHPPSKQNFTGF